MSDEQNIKAFLRRLIRIFRRRPPPPPEGWNRAILNLYPKECPLMAALPKTMDENDPHFGWWKEELCPTNDTLKTGSKDS